MPRLLLSDEHWSKLREILLDKTICNKRDIRMTVKGMLYRMRTGCPWKTYPERSETGIRSTSVSMHGPLQADGSRSSRGLWLSPIWNGISLMATMPRLTSTVQVLPVAAMKLLDNKAPRPRSRESVIPSKATRIRIEGPVHSSGYPCETATDPRYRGDSPWLFLPPIGRVVFRVGCSVAVGGPHP